MCKFLKWTYSSLNANGLNNCPCKGCMGGLQVARNMMHDVCKEYEVSGEVWEVGSGIIDVMYNNVSYL